MRYESGRARAVVHAAGGSGRNARNKRRTRPSSIIEQAMNYRVPNCGPPGANRCAVRRDARVAVREVAAQFRG